MSLVYKYTFPNGKIYIGKTVNTIEKRAGSNGVHYGSNTLVGRAIRKYGWINIKKEVIKDNLSNDEASELEKQLISEYNSTNRDVGYNLTKGGDGGAVKGHIVTEETRKKIGASNSVALKGKKLSPETVEKVRQAHIGKSLSEETKRKISVANTGKHPTEETRQKLSKNNCMHNPEVREKMKQSLKKSQTERTRKRLNTIRERYPDGLKQTEESNRKRSEALKGKPKSEETKQKMRKPKSPEAIENMRKAQKEAWKRRKAKQE